MIVDIVDKYCTDDNNPIKNLRLNMSFSFQAIEGASKHYEAHHPATEACLLCGL
jgi:hypothetical protein